LRGMPWAFPIGVGHVKSHVNSGLAAGIIRTMSLGVFSGPLKRGRLSSPDGS